MANGLKMVQQELLYSLFGKGWSNRKIHKALKLHRTTVARHRVLWKKQLSAESEFKDNPSDSAAANAAIQSVPPMCPPSKVVHFQLPTDPLIDSAKTSKSKVAQYRDIILEKLENGQHAKSIYQDLVIEYDYNGAYDSVKRFVRLLGKNSFKVYDRIETLPGEEAQVDFGEGAPVLVNGRYRKPSLFVMTLSNSRKSYEEVVWEQDVETFLRCHEHAFAAFGGVPKTVVVDNLKSAVLKAHLYEPAMNPNYLAFAEHYNFVPLPCRPRTPEHKGKVECGGVKYTQDNALKGKRFLLLADQNNHLRFWNKRWASTRIHGTTKRQVEQMFQEEKPFLQPLPETTFNYFKIGIRSVSTTDSHIEVASAYYPVPPQYMGKKVTVHYNSTLIKVYYHDKIIQKLSAISKGKFHPDQSCLADFKSISQSRFVQYLFEQCDSLGPSVYKWAKEAEVIRKQMAYRAIKGVIALSKRFAPNTINWACQQAMEANSYNYHIVKSLTENRAAQLEIQQEIQFTQEGDLIRPPQYYHDLMTGGSL